jgi:hypothetical protein
MVVLSIYSGMFFYVNNTSFFFHWLLFFFISYLTIIVDYRPFHGNCGAVIGACAQTLPDGNIFKHKMVICIALFTSAQIGETVLLKRMVSVFFYLPQRCEEEKVLG